MADPKVKVNDPVLTEQKIEALGGGGLDLDAGKASKVIEVVADTALHGLGTAPPVDGAGKRPEDQAQAMLRKLVHDYPEAAKIAIAELKSQHADAGMVDLITSDLVVPNASPKSTPVGRVFPNGRTP